MDTSDSEHQPSSMLHVRASTLYPLPGQPETLGGPGCPPAPPPFPLLSGEAVVHQGSSVDGPLALTNYRLYVQVAGRRSHVPLGVIEVVEVRDMFYLHVGCKDARSYRCTFENNEQCSEWFRRLIQATAPPHQLEDLFAFYFKAWASDFGSEDVINRLESTVDINYDDVSFKSEMERLGFDLHGTWRISQANINYRLCPSYPPLLLVPACITDETLEIVARFRSSKRIPAVVWRHAGNGAVIARCSQPEVGWLGWRSAEDEDLLKAIADACAIDRGPRSMLDGNSAPHTPTGLAHVENSSQELNLPTGKKVLIMDARSYTTAVANRARGGGCECPEYYPSCDIQFMNLANIHSIRKSFHSLRQLCASSADQPNWFSLLEGTRWLQHMSGLIRAAVTLVTGVERDARPVLVHCSDGWDRTPQIVALAELLLDPYYRTVEGFQVLVEREWLAFGHKFADRCGHNAGSDDQNERCPVFLQWLDCVHQLLTQFPCSFQFSHTYLVKLAQHIYSNLFGTFLCNTKQERVERVNDKTFSVWRFLNAPCFKNHLYAAPSSTTGNQVLWPAYNVRDLHLWSEVYIGSLEMSGSECGPSSVQGECALVVGAGPAMTKTRSYGDLMGAAEPCPSQVRRSSDPNLTLDTMKLSSLSLSSIDTQQDDIRSELNHTITSTDILSALESIDIQQNGYDIPSEEPLVNDTEEIPAVKSTQNGYILNGNGILPAETNGYSKKHDLNIEEFEDDNNLGFNIQNFSNGAPTIETPLLNKFPENNLPLSRDFPNVFKLDLTKKVNDVEVYSKADINHNGELKKCEEVKCADDDSDNDRSESKSEVTLCPSPMITGLMNAKSNETSTDTLVAENGVVTSNEVPETIAAPEKPEITQNGTDVCKVCAQNRKFIGDKHYHSRSTSGKTSRYSTPPLYSRTPSGALAATPGGTASSSCDPMHRRLDVDGLAPLRSDLQHRVWQILENHRKREEALHRELHTTRMALIKQVCHNCNHNDTDKLDDTGSLVDSVCSTGEGQASIGESVPSDVSWEALDEGMPSVENTRTLWVPDHAVSRCTGCHTEFWLGRRKHHCRNCGRIFCADCSENSTPLPSEHLYSPVRVCTACYAELRRELPDKCKHAVAKVHAAGTAPHPGAAAHVTATTN